MYKPEPVDGRATAESITRQGAARAGAMTGVIAAAGVVVLGGFLRLYGIGAESFWRDEVTMVNVASRSVGDIIAMADAGGGRPPAYVLSAHLWLQLFGTSEAAARSLSALFGILAVLALYFVGRELLGNVGGLIAAFLMAISEVQIQQSQNFRYYSLLVLVTLLSFLLYVVALRTGKWWHFALYVVATVLMFFTHSFGVFSIAAQGLYFVLTWKRHRKVFVPWLVSEAAVALAIAPGVLLAAKKTTAGSSAVMDWITVPSAGEVAMTPVRYVSSGMPPALALVVGAAFALAGLGVYAARRGTGTWLRDLRSLPASVVSEARADADPLVLLVCWLACPIVIPYLLSLVFGPFYLERYTIGAAPALYLLLAFGAIAVRRVAPEALTLGTLAILIVPGLWNYYATAANEQWRETAAYIAQHEEAGDAVAFAPGQGTDAERAFDWYYRGSIREREQVCELASGPQTEGEIAAALNACVAGAPRFWFVVGDFDRPEKFKAFVADPAKQGLALLDKKPFTGMTVYLFKPSR